MICRRKGTEAQGLNGTAPQGQKGKMQLAVDSQFRCDAPVKRGLAIFGFQVRSTILFIESGCHCDRQGAEHRSIILHAIKDIIDLPSALL
jgi:hypothetical protein